MLEKLINFGLGCTRPGKPLLSHQSVRWRRPRKPFWLGIAKSKMFVVKEVKDNKTPEEAAEHKRLTDSYNRYVKSLLKFIREDNPLIRERLAAEAVDSEQQLEIERQFERSYEINSIWNAESAKKREVRLRNAVTEIEQQSLEIIDTAEKKKQDFQNKVEEIIKIQKVASESFITPENLDEAIEKCLSNVVNYNYAIDLDGNKLTDLQMATMKVETLKLEPEDKVN